MRIPTLTAGNQASVNPACWLKFNDKDLSAVARDSVLV